MRRQLLQIKSAVFAERILKMQRYLRSKWGFVEAISQVSRSGTSIGANIAEAFSARSDADFVARLHISLKEAKETAFWLKALYGADYLLEREYMSIDTDCQELIRLLTFTLKKKKSDMNADRKS